MYALRKKTVGADAYIRPRVDVGIDPYIRHSELHRDVAIPWENVM